MDNLTKKNFVGKAEETIKGLHKGRNGDTKNNLTNNQIRNLLSFTTTVYNNLLRHTDGELSEDLQSDIQYMKMKFTYAASRYESVNELIEKGNIFTYINQIGTSRDYALLFCKYMESLVAYHKYYTEVVLRDKNRR